MSGTEGTHGNDAWNNGFDEPLETEQLALAGQDERLPWLESPDDEDFAFDRPNTGGLIKLALLGLVLLGGVVGGVWWATHRVTTEEVVADGSLVPAPPGPYKEAPKDPGGKQFAGTGDQTFVVLDGQSSAPQLAGGEVVPAPAAPTPEPKPAASAKPSAAPSPTPSASAAPSGVGVQVGAYSSKAQAEAGWTRLVAQSNGALSGVSHRVLMGTADIGTIYRLQAVAGDRASATALCTQLKSAGIACQVK